MRVSRRQPLGDRIFELLRQHIVIGEIAAGERLVQSDLAAELGTSRLPVRDALRRLEAEGLLTSDELGRYTVVRFTVEDAAEIYAIRQRLESPAISLAGKRATREQITRIEKLFIRVEQAVRQAQVDAYLGLNAQFHTLIYDSSNAPHLVRLLRSLWVGISPLTPLAAHGGMHRSHGWSRVIRPERPVRSSATSRIPIANLSPTS